MLSKYLFIRDCIDSILNILMLVLNVLYIPTFFHSFFKGKGNVHILGNGPSLKTDWERLMLRIQPGDSILCVNMFAGSQLYKTVKPNLYVLVDPAFFSTTLSKELQQKVNGTIEALINETEWELTLFIPFFQRNKECVNRIKSNKYIHICFLKNVPTIGGFSFINAVLYKLNLSNPLFQNVAGASLYIAIKAKFEQVFLWGVDHSWLEYETVQSDNKVYIKSRHCYDDGKDVPMVVPSPGFLLHEHLLEYVRCFHCYHNLKKYALLNKTKVFNCASVSWIDAFERLN